MELYIGGYAQGKMEYVKTIHPDMEYEIIHDFHLQIKSWMKDGKDAFSMTETFLKKHPNAIIICNEIGNGIVPLDAFEREYRETVGRILIMIAKKATRVERVICGIGQRIK